jgi:hypothetical protein
VKKCMRLMTYIFILAYLFFLTPLCQANSRGHQKRSNESSYYIGAGSYWGQLDFDEYRGTGKFYGKVLYQFGGGFYRATGSNYGNGWQLGGMFDYRGLAWQLSGKNVYNETGNYYGIDWQIDSNGFYRETGRNYGDGLQSLNVSTQNFWVFMPAMGNVGAQNSGGSSEGGWKPMGHGYYRGTGSNYGNVLQSNDICDPQGSGNNYASSRKSEGNCGPQGFGSWNSYGSSWNIQY